MTILTNLKVYDWSTWAMGLMRSFIAGGAGAAGGVIGPMVTDGKDWNLGTGLGHVLESMAISFLVVGLAHMFIFLQTHAIPDPVEGAKAMSAGNSQ